MEGATRISPRKVTIFAAFVILLVALVYFAAFHGPGMPTGAFALAKDVESSIDSKNFDKIFSKLSPDVIKAGSNSSFAKRLSARFEDTKIDFVEVFKKDSDEAFAVYNLTKGNQTELITLEFQKGKTWFLNSFSDLAKCEDDCAAADYPMCDGKNHVACKDTNNDGCTERISTVCPVACSSTGCTNTPENFILKPYDTITAFPVRVQLLDIAEDDKSATFDIANDIFEIKKGSTETIANLKITATGIDKKLKKVSVNIKSAVITDSGNNTS
ncbi:MAG: hypothetical protein HY438_03005 [DPANN group archaeon]|nr:hypothetical protein [DPANN group archaeon]